MIEGPTGLLDRNEYFEWLKSFPSDYCPFCDRENNITVRSGEYWDLILCKAPYWRYHFMLVPIRHIQSFQEINTEELQEFIAMCDDAIKKLQEAGLAHTDGTPIDRFLFFWRFRENALDPVTQVVKPDHFHFHIVPEKEHLWDTVLDPDASAIDVGEIKEMFS